MLVWAFKVHISERLSGNSLVRPMLKHLQSKGASAHAHALGLQKDGWSCGYQSLHLCDAVARPKGSLEDVGVILSPLHKGFVKEALRIINADCSIRVPSTIPENGWEGEVSCWKRPESLLAPASDSESPPLSTSPSLLMKRILFRNLRATLLPPPRGQ